MKLTFSKQYTGDAIILLDRKAPGITAITSAEKNILGYTDITVQIVFDATASRPEMTVHIETSIDGGDTWISFIKSRVSQAFPLNHKPHLIRASVERDDIAIAPNGTVTVQYLGIKS